MNQWKTKQHKDAAHKPAHRQSSGDSACDKENGPISRYVVPGLYLTPFGNSGRAGCLKSRC